MNVVGMAFHNEINWQTHIENVINKAENVINKAENVLHAIKQIKKSLKR